MAKVLIYGGYFADDSPLQRKAVAEAFVQTAITEFVVVLSERERARRRHCFEREQREDGRHFYINRRDELDEASIDWSRELREKVAASSAAAAERERLQVVVDLDW